MKKIILWVVVGLVAVLAVAYLAAGYFIYDKLSVVSVEEDRLENNPSDFQVVYEEVLEAVGSFDTTAYWMPEFEEITFSSRQAEITLSGWYIPSGDPAAPAVVVTHGIGASKIASNALTVAGMLHKNGFNVLMYDMRNHGQSSRDNGRTSIGNKEYQDVLGAWDYLVNERGFDPTQVGLYGLSLGGAAALNAFAEEPRVAAVLVDSPFSDLQKIISEELVRTGYPALLAPAGILSARLIDGVDLLAHTPQDAIRKAAGRPIFIIHGTQDARINFHHSQALEALSKETGANVTFWYVEGADHVLSVFLQSEAYEQKMAAFYKGALGGK